MTKDPRNESETSTGKPLQRIPYTEKMKNGQAWFKQNADYYLRMSNFGFTTGGRRDRRVLYDVYNNKFPLEWFEHITNPLNAKDPHHKKFPAKIRPTSMIRTNLDLLLEEFAQRPLAFQVENMGEDGYNSYLDGLSKAIEQNLSEHFLAVAQSSMQAAGHTPGQTYQQIPQDQQIELPDSVKERFKGSYKDNLAIYGQKWVKRALREYHIRQKFLKGFKDWLISGDVCSYKNLEHGNFVYERVSPLELDYDKSPDVTFIEDGEWVIRRYLCTLADVVDTFYDELTDADHNELETTAQWNTPFQLYEYLSSSPTHLQMGKVPVYHVQWKGRKQIIHATYTDPLTGKTQELILDEDTPPAPDMKIVKKEWVNEVYETTVLGNDIYCKMRPIPVQRNEMNNFSRCKLSYNGRRYSDTHSENVSVLEMGLPCAIMYMVTNFMIEKTIAKNKGKIALIDKNTIPHRNGWDDEKWMYYADALGWGLLDRNQQGVDRSWNQYTVLDMSLWNDLKSLIELRDSFSSDWDNLLGINAQRKAQIGSSDGLGTTQQALAQSAIITGMIFTLYEEYLERELQGFLDFSRFMAADGIKTAYNLSDYDRDLLDMDPDEYCSADLGLFITFSADQLRILQQYKAQTQAMIQNGVPQSTILTVQAADNVAELKEKLKMLEDKEIEMAQASKEDEHQKAMEIEAIKEQYEKTRSLLKINEINAEWDRRDQNEIIKGSYLNSSMEEQASQGTVAPDPEAMANRILETQRLLSEQRQQSADRAQSAHQHAEEMQVKREEMASREKVAKLQAATALKNRVSGQKKTP